jgi:hypothetical protein
MKLDASEKEILDCVEKGEWHSARGLKGEKKRYAGHSAATVLGTALSDPDPEPHS